MTPTGRFKQGPEMQSFASRHTSHHTSNKMVNVDYADLELRVLAHMAQTVRQAQQTLEWSRSRKAQFHNIWKNSGFKNDAAYSKYMEAIDEEKKATEFLKEQGALK